MGKLKKDHVLASGGGALAAGAAGAVLGGLVAGPPGSVIGAVAGAALGAVGGQKASEAMDTDGDLGHFEQIYTTMPYYVDGMAWSDYAPAYAYGIASTTAQTGMPQRAISAEAWEQARGGSRLSWADARPAVEHARRDLDETTRNEDAAG